MITVDAPPIWLPPAPAIIRPADSFLLRPSFLPASPAARRAAIKELVSSGRISRDEAAQAVVFFAPVFFSGKSKALVLIDRTTGTNLGSLTEGGGLAAAFDGVTSQLAANSAYVTTAPVQAGYVGKNLSAARCIGQVVAYGASNAGYTNVANATLTIRAKNGAPTGPTDGTAIGSVSITNATTGPNAQTIASTDLVSTWTHVWLAITALSTRYYLAELQLYAWE